MLRGYQAEVRHEFTRVIEAGQIAELGNNADGHSEPHPAHGLDGLDDRVIAPVPDLVFEFTGRLDLEPTFPILFDRESRIAEQYDVKGLPTTYLLDKDGSIRFRAIGGREFDHPEGEALIEGLL